MATLAQKHNAKLKDEAAPEELVAIKSSGKGLCAKTWATVLLPAYCKRLF